MINKVKKQDVKFAEMLAADVIKNLIDNENIIHSKDKNDQDFNDKTCPYAMPVTKYLVWKMI